MTLPPAPTPPPSRLKPPRNTSSLSLRWRVMLLAMSMVAMVVVLMSVAACRFSSEPVEPSLEDAWVRALCLMWPDLPAAGLHEHHADVLPDR